MARHRLLLLAASRSQARVAFDYVCGFLDASPILRQQILGITSEEVRLKDNVVIAVHAGSYRTIRGRTLLAVVADETSFWRDETSAQPDVEVFRACAPALAASGGIWIGISTGYRKIGLLYQKWRDHFGHDGDDVLVVQGPSSLFNSSLDLGMIERATAADPEAAESVASRFTKTEMDGNGDEVERDIPFLKAYTVFCVDQIDGLPEYYYGRAVTVPAPIERNADADAFFANTSAIVRHGGTSAFYAPSSDHIQMPPIESFRDTQSYVAVRAHETVHWTAPAHRVNRDLSRYGKDRSERAREELIAELGSCFLCADLGIVPELEPRPDHASYLASWMEVLSNEKRFLFSAAAHAQRAVAYLHELQPKAAGIEEAA